MFGYTLQKGGLLLALQITYYFLGPFPRPLPEGLGLVEGQLPPGPG